MKPEAREAFLPFTIPLEGLVRHMYLDVKGLVTTGVGNLIDTPADALSLPWRNADGSLATRMQIAAEWHVVKSQQGLRTQGGGAFAKVTQLHLDDAGINALVTRTLDRMDHALCARFAGYEGWPWQAQLATLSVAWACGAAFAFPKLEAALRARDFTTASVESHISTVRNPGVAARNRGQSALYLKAAAIQPSA